MDETTCLVLAFKLQRELEYKQYFDDRDKNKGAEQGANKWIVATVHRTVATIHLLARCSARWLAIAE